MMRKIVLSKGQHAIVDDEVFFELNRHKWHVHGRKYFYVTRQIDKGFGQGVVQILMDKQIMGCELEPHKRVFHLNGDSLDHRHGNLVVCEKPTKRSNKA